MTNDTNVPQFTTAAIEAALAAARQGDPALRGRGRPALTPEQRAERVTAAAALKAEKAAAKLAKQELRLAAAEQKRAERASAPPRPPRVSKLDRAADRLPVLSEGASGFINSLDVGDYLSVIKHLQFKLRTTATVDNTQVGLKAGQVVRILGGNHKFVGQLGTITKARRVRCYVTPVGSERELYLLTGEVEAVETQTVAEEMVLPSQDELNAGYFDDVAG